MDRRDWKSRNVAEPQPGYFLTRLVRKGPLVPAQIRHVNGLWSAVINGQSYSSAADPAAAPRVFSIWHSSEEITAAEYAKRLSQSLNAKPGDPLSEPDKPIDLVDRPPLF
jgi:hypothetical protein